jgi:hypothetical protein
MTTNEAARALDLAQQQIREAQAEIALVARSMNHARPGGFERAVRKANAAAVDALYFTQDARQLLADRIFGQGDISGTKDLARV